MYYRGLHYLALYHVRITQIYCLQALTRLCFYTISQTFLRLRTFADGYKVNVTFVFPIQRTNFSSSVLELKKNCPPELIIYIVGSKADLHRNRQVTPDLARLSLHNWFPPTKPSSPPPLPQSSTLSYIRPRFTSLPGLLSPTFKNTPPIAASPPPEAPAYLDLPSDRSALNRRISLQSRQTKNNGSGIRSSASSGTRTPQSSRFGSHLVHTPESIDNSSNSIEEADEDEDDDSEWGLSKGMELFEVSAKDNIGQFFYFTWVCITSMPPTGIQQLFEHLISSIITRKDIIERENELRKRDSVFLDSSPSWSKPPEEVESDKAQRWGSWSCC